MKKVLLSIIMVNLMLATTFQAVFSANAVSISDKKDGIPKLKYKDYRNCTVISEGYWGVDGTAILFPGWRDSQGNETEVIGASGILIDGGNCMLTSELYIVNDGYWGKWIAFVYSFTGSFGNIAHVYVDNVFFINGIASFVRIYYIDY